MRLFRVLAGASFALASAGASAAETKNIVEVKPGEVVYDRQGGTVATVRRVGDDDAVVDTGTTKITLGLDSFRRLGGKLVLPMNRAALEAAAGKVQAAGDGEVLALLTPGAAFYDKDGVAVGTVVSADAKQVMLEAGEFKAGLPVSAFTRGAEGARIGSTRADFLATLESQRVASAAVAAPTEKKAD